MPFSRTRPVAARLRCSSPLTDPVQCGQVPTAAALRVPFHRPAGEPLPPPWRHQTPLKAVPSGEKTKIAGPSSWGPPFSRQVSRVYFFDLAGAGVGCLLVVFVMSAVSPPGAVVIAATALSAGGILFALPRRGRRLVEAALGTVLVAGLGATAFTSLTILPSPEKFLYAFLQNPGSATAPEDYTATSTTVTIEAGTTGTTVDVPLNPDTLDEADETFTVRATSATGVDIDDRDGVVTITDDDAAPSVSVDDASVTEGTGGAALCAVIDCRDSC